MFSNFVKIQNYTYVAQCPTRHIAYRWKILQQNQGTTELFFGVRPYQVQGVG
jgi:hypothetical protein